MKAIHQGGLFSKRVLERALWALCARKYRKPCLYQINVVFFDDTCRFRSDTGNFLSAADRFSSVSCPISIEVGSYPTTFLCQVLGLIKKVTPQTFDSSFGTEMHHANGCEHVRLKPLTLIGIHLLSAPVGPSNTEYLVKHAIEEAKTAKCPCANSILSQTRLSCSDTLIIYFMGENTLDFTRNMRYYPFSGFEDKRFSTTQRFITNSPTIALDAEKFRLTGFTTRVQHTTDVHAITYTGPYGNFESYCVDGDYVQKVHGDLYQAMPAELLIYERVGASNGLSQHVGKLEAEKEELR